MCLSVVPKELGRLWLANGLPEDFLSHLKLHGDPDSVVNSSFRIGLTAQIAIGLAGLSAAYLHYLRHGIEQDVYIDARHAALSFHSEAWYTINDAPPEGNIWDSIAGLYKTIDGGWVRIHTNFPHHRMGILEILKIPDQPDSPTTKSQVAARILTWSAFDLEEACAQKKMCVTALRTYEEWLQHEQAKALVGVPPIEVRKVREGRARTSINGGKRDAMRPLEGIKVLDLSRVLAGPIAGRTLAAHGAQVVLITSPLLPSLPFLDAETSLGKRTIQLDLLSSSDREKLVVLARNTDVILQAYRPGGIRDKGFGVNDMINLREGRGIVCANLRAWGWDGPWQGRRGFDSLVQTATGFNVDDGLAYQAYVGADDWAPRPLPMQALDHAAAYFLAFGVNVALSRMIMEGGSYDVRVSLAAVGQWVRSLGRLAPDRAFGVGRPLPKREDEEIADLSVEWNEREGKGDGKGRKMSALKHACVLGKTPVREGVVRQEVEDEDWGAPMRLDADDFETVSTLWGRI